MLLTALLLSWLSMVTATTFDVNLTANATSRYGLNSPLLVNLSDSIIFKCNEFYSNVFILASQEQWQSCDATTGGAPFQWAYCVNNVPSSSTVTISHHSNSLNGVYSFDQGQDYYLASFSDGTKSGAINFGAISGGECLAGVKMVIRVQEAPASPAATSPATSSKSTPAGAMEIGIGGLVTTGWTMGTMPSTIVVAVLCAAVLVSTVPV